MHERPPQETRQQRTSDQNRRIRKVVDRVPRCCRELFAGSKLSGMVSLTVSASHGLKCYPHADVKEETVPPHKGTIPSQTKNGCLFVHVKIAFQVVAF